MMQTDYGEGRLVHITQARLALSSPQSFQPLRIVAVHDDVILAKNKTGESIRLRCCEAPRLSEVIAEQNPPGRADGLYRDADGWLARWSPRYHLLAVPSGPPKASGQVEILLVFEMLDGAVTKTLADTGGVSLHLFNVAEVRDHPA